MIKLKLCDNKRYIIQMLPHFIRGGDEALLRSSFGSIYTCLYPASYQFSISVWGDFDDKDYSVVEAYDGSLKRDLRLYELWAESINERFVVCLS